MSSSSQLMRLESYGCGRLLRMRAALERLSIRTRKSAAVREEAMSRATARSSDQEISVLLQQLDLPRRVRSSQPSISFAAAFHSEEPLVSDIPKP
jgi:hypothetical protein